MKLKSIIAAAGAVATLGFAATSQAATMNVTTTFPYSIDAPFAGVKNIATNFDGASSYFYEIVVGALNPSNQYLKVLTRSTDPLGGDATYRLYADQSPNASATARSSSVDTSSPLGTWTQTDLAGNSTTPYYKYLLSANSEYVLEINLGSGQDSINTTLSTVPLPGAVWLFGSALLAFMGLSRRKL
jgi:hypothetical protein